MIKKLYIFFIVFYSKTMKKLLLLLIPFFLFTSCNYNAKHYDVALSINESNSVIFHSGLGTNNYFETSVNSEITGKYFLVPDKDDKIVDDTRFLLKMNDGNSVYINLAKLKSLKSYQKIYASLGDKKGVLHLDSGEYLEVK